MGAALRGAGGDTPLFLCVLISKAKGSAARVSKEDVQQPYFFELVLSQRPRRGDPAAAAADVRGGLANAPAVDPPCPTVVRSADRNRRPQLFVLVRLEGRVAVVAVPGPGCVASASLPQTSQSWVGHRCLAPGADR